MDGKSSVLVSQAKVAILLCTYHGQTYLAEQLDSFERQTHANWQVWASDDGSLDDTHVILESYRRKWPEGRLSINIGPAEGFVMNFLSLMCNATINADYYAYSDQDDIWEANKLARAVDWLNTIPKNIPGLYCSRTRIVDSNNNEIGASPVFRRPPSFANALMQNIGGGNTMVVNNAARCILQEAGEMVPAVMHDWWTYLVVTGCGGQVCYDRVPTLRYRQHGSNLVGGNATWVARIKRIQMIWQGGHRTWTDRNIASLRAISHRLTQENLDLLNQFERARNMDLVARLINMKKCGVYRQTLLGNLGLIAAATFGKL